MIGCIQGCVPLVDRDPTILILVPDKISIPLKIFTVWKHSRTEVRVPLPPKQCKDLLVLLSVRFRVTNAIHNADLRPMLANQ